MTCNSTRVVQETGETISNEIPPFTVTYRMERNAEPWSSMQVSGGETYGVIGDPDGQIVAGQKLYTLRETQPDGWIRYYIGGIAIWDGMYFYIKDGILTGMEKPQRRFGARMLCQYQ
jgi:hypothetical protein